MTRIKEFFKSISTTWRGISKSQRTSVIIVLCSLVLAIVIYFFTLGRTNYTPIFTNLNIQDSGQIVNKLEEMRITNYKIEDGGTTILVPEKEVDRLRLDLAMNGVLPNSGQGFEIFDDTGFAITDDDRKILYQRALEGELKRSIMTLHEVENARVHLALAQESVFSREEKPATASVILNTRPFETLSQDQIKGIISLVSGAVKNLPEENVRVVDAQANLLSQGVLDGNGSFQSSQSTNERMEIQKQFEHNLQNDLQTMLEQTLGMGKVLVKINADLDFDSQETTEIAYGEGVIRSQQIHLNQNGDGVEGEGQGPIDNNTQNYIDENIGSLIEGGQLNSYQSITNNELDESTTYTIKAPGEVKRISTSVVYDGQLTPAMQQSIENVVRGATGFNDERGDNITVEAIPFDTSYQDQIQEQLAREQAIIAEQEEARRRLMVLVGIPLGIILATLIIIGIIRISRNRRYRKLEPAIDIRADEQIPIEDIIQEPIINIESNESTEERSVKEYAENNPEKMAELLRAWILEDER